MNTHVSILTEPEEFLKAVVAAFNERQASWQGKQSSERTLEEFSKMK